MKKLKTLDHVARTDGADFTISIDHRGRYFAHQIGEAIPSAFPGRPAGPERFAYPLNPLKRYGNRHRKGWTRRSFPTFDACLIAIQHHQARSYDRTTNIHHTQKA